MKEVEFDEVWLGCVATFWFMAASAFNEAPRLSELGELGELGEFVSGFKEDQPRLRIKSSRGTTSR